MDEVWAVHDCLYDSGVSFTDTVTLRQKLELCVTKGPTDVSLRKQMEHENNRFMVEKLMQAFPTLQASMNPVL
jgi:hypothetical protein